MEGDKLVSLKEIAPYLKPWFLKYSTPLFHINDQGRREVVGSGTFVNLGDKKILITARHVISQYPFDQIFIPRRTSKGLEHVFGTCKASLYPPFLDDDSIDIAYFELDDIRLSKIETEYSFLPMEYIDFKHAPSDEFIYCAAGFPHRKAKFKKAYIGDVSLIQENIFNPGSKKWAYKDGFNTDDHIIMDYSRKMLNEITFDLVKTPKIEGMSGGSLWHIDPKIKFYIDRPNVKMVGILTQYSTSHIYSTNIKHLHEI